eukprot:1095582-Pyramimonas_sp.AAC.1
MKGKRGLDPQKVEPRTCLQQEFSSMQIQECLDLGVSTVGRADRQHHLALFRSLSCVVMACDALHN